MLDARKKRYIDAINRLQNGGFVNAVSLILAVPIEQKGKGSLNRCITGGGKNGYRTKERPNHNGIDFNGGPFAEGYAPEVNFLARDAKCTRSELHSSYGNVVDISATIPCRVKGEAKTGKVTFRFAHLHNRNVKKGDTVPLWAELGKVGSTGDSSGAHLHFETWVDGTRINPHDLDYLAPIADKPTTHVVQRGDTYGKISIIYGVPVADLRRWNGWTDRDIPVGAHMWLVEPPQASVPEPEEPPHPEEPETVDLAELEALITQVAEMAEQMAQIAARLAAVKKVL